MGGETKYSQEVFSILELGKYRTVLGWRVQQLGTFAAFVEDHSLVPSIHIGWLTTWDMQLSSRGSSAPPLLTPQGAWTSVYIPLLFTYA